MAGSQLVARSKSEVHSHTSLVSTEGNPSVDPRQRHWCCHSTKATSQKNNRGWAHRPSRFPVKQPEQVSPDVESVREKQQFPPAPKLPRSRPVCPFPGPLRDP